MSKMVMIVTALVATIHLSDSNDISLLAINLSSAPFCLVLIFNKPSRAIAGYRSQALDVTCFWPSMSMTRHTIWEQAPMKSRSSIAFLASISKELLEHANEGHHLQ